MRDDPPALQETALDHIGQAHPTLGRILDAHRPLTQHQSCGWHIEHVRRQAQELGADVGGGLTGSVTDRKGRTAALGAKIERRAVGVSAHHGNIRQIHPEVLGENLRCPGHHRGGANLGGARVQHHCTIGIELHVDPRRAPVTVHQLQASPLPRCGPAAVPQPIAAAARSST